MAKSRSVGRPDAGASRNNNTTNGERETSTSERVGLVRISSPSPQVNSQFTIYTQRSHTQ